MLAAAGGHAAAPCRGGHDCTADAPSLSIAEPQQARAKSRACGQYKGWVSAHGAPPAAALLDSKLQRPRCVRISGCMPACRAPRKALLTAHSRTPPLVSHRGHVCGAPAAGRIRMSHTHGRWDDAHTAVLEHPTRAAFRRRGHTPNQRRREVRALLLVHGGLHVLLSDAQHARWWQCCILGLALRSLLCCCLQCCPVLLQLLA